jgi:hypothetical protein
VQEDVRNGLPTALVRDLGGVVMAEFVRFTLNNGSEVLFELVCPAFSGQLI